jgi:hypothetical protein
MKRIAILVIIGLLVISGSMAAMAYNQAVITNAGNITVNNTNQSLLALIPHNGVGNKDLTAEIQNGNLVFDFGRGDNPFFGGDQQYGLQKNSEYVWGGPDVSYGLFTYQNRSAETIVVEMKVEGVPSGVKIYFAGQAGPMNNWVEMTDGAFHVIQPLGWGSVASGNSCAVNVKITVDDLATFKTTTPLTVTVKATAQ